MEIIYKTGKALTVAKPDVGNHQRRQRSRPAARPVDPTEM